MAYSSLIIQYSKLTAATKVHCYIYHCPSLHVEVSKVYHNSVSATEVIFRLLETSGNFKCTVLEESTNRHVLNSTVSAGIDVKIDTLTPNTTYSIRCTGIEDQCVEVDVMFTTATIKGKGSI